MPNSDVYFKELLDEVLEVEEGLGSWELEFLESLSEQYDETKSFSEKQRVKLEEVWERHCG